MKTYLAALALVLSVSTAHASIIKGDFRTESNLPQYRHGKALVYENLGATVGTGAELTAANFRSNRDLWGGGQVNIDLDPTTNRLTLKSNDTWDFQTFDAYLSDLVFDSPGRITGITTVSDDLVNPFYLPEISFTDDSLHISFNSITGKNGEHGKSEDKDDKHGKNGGFKFTGGEAVFQLLVTAPPPPGDTLAPTAAPVPEPSTLALFGLGLAGLGIWRKRSRKA